jgi:hypothetical protein
VESWACGRSGRVVEVEVECRGWARPTVDVGDGSRARSVSRTVTLGRRDERRDRQSATGSGSTLARAHQAILQVQLCDVLFLMCIRSHAVAAKTHGSTRRPPEPAVGRP